MRFEMKGTRAMRRVIPAMLAILAAASVAAPAGAQAGGAGAGLGYAPAGRGGVGSAARGGASTTGLQGDPADSLYRAGQSALNRDDFRRAAEIFRSLPTRFPRSRLVADALYWQAFALYRSGGPENLRAARQALERHQSQHRGAASAGDAETLLTRVHGELARLGDEASVRFIRERAGATGSGGGTGAGSGTGTGTGAGPAPAPEPALRAASVRGREPPAAAATRMTTCASPR